MQGLGGEKINGLFSVQLLTYVLKNDILCIDMGIKCRHGVSTDGFCCKCTYGENSHIEYNEQQNRDLVDDIHIGIGYKLKRAYSRELHGHDDF